MNSDDYFLLVWFLAFSFIGLGIYLHKKEKTAFIHTRLELARSFEHDKIKKSRNIIDKIFTNLEQRAYRSGLQENAATLRKKAGIAGTVLTAILALMSGGNIILSILGFLGGYAYPWFLVKKGEADAARNIELQVEEAANRMLAMIRNVPSILKGMEMAAEVPDPVGRAFREAVYQLYRGQSMEVTLEQLRKQIPTQDMDMLVTGLLIAAEKRADAAKTVLEITVNIIRKRDSLRSAIRTQTAMATMSFRFVGSVPILIMLYVLASADNREAFTNNSVGIVLLCFCIVSYIIGVIWAKRILNLKKIIGA